MAHILNTPGTAERSGWWCPSCGRAYAPWVYSCPHCPAKMPETCGSPEAAHHRLTLRLPPYMAGENAVQVEPVTGTWREVFPGLQAQLRTARQGHADVEFRLTPEGRHESPDC